MVHRVIFFGQAAGPLSFSCAAAAPAQFVWKCGALSICMPVYYPDFNGFRRAQRNAVDRVAGFKPMMLRRGGSLAARKVLQVPSVPVNTALTYFTYTDGSTSTSNDVIITESSYDTAERSVQSVVVGTAVTAIGGTAFYLRLNLATVTILPGCASIGQFSFNTSALTGITMPGTVTSIGEAAFIFCDNLQSIDIDASNANYSSDSGVFFNKTKTVLIQYPAKRPGTAYVIPAGVQTIGEAAFFRAYLLTSTTIPASVTTIEENAFLQLVGSLIFLGNAPTLIGYALGLGSNTVYRCTVATGFTNPFGLCPVVVQSC